MLGTGISAKLDSFAAGKEAAQIAHYRIGKLNANIVIAFISTIFDQELAIKGIRSVIRDVPLIGCSSAGSIANSGISRGSISVSLIRSEAISFSLGIAKDVSKNSRSAGHEAAKQALSKSNRSKTTKSLMIFSDSLSGNSADILRGAQEMMGTSFPIIGGGAADELCFRKTYQYINNNIYTNSVAGLLFSGDINIGIGRAHGWQPVGKPHRITRSSANILKEIDRRPAIEIYEEYLGKSFEELKELGLGKLGVSYPFGIRLKEKNEYLVRSPLKAEDNGSLVLNAELPEGEDINLMIGDKNMALEATRKACMEAMGNIQNRNIRFIACFSNIGRYQLLRESSVKETEIIKEIFGENIPILGFYSYGEYASDFQNQAISIAVFSE
ncbi:MAG: FIST C-terminal domain-containing protein [Candidatus Omnitrophica bacterium]|nr:FIST C-terminal domain-containing protein [Candidatus Omnitrophota bacterium]